MYNPFSVNTLGIVLLLVEIFVVEIFVRKHCASSGVKANIKIVFIVFAVRRVIVFVVFFIVVFLFLSSHARARIYNQYKYIVV